MATPNPTRYRAFLSYSHTDDKFARWLHKHLEAWPVAKDLVGRQTPVGKVPSHLRPIFRDRDDFSGGHSLKEATIAALEVSEFLVVLCSPHSANSTYVNEEVRLFKAMGRADRIIPVIIAGEPGDEKKECFPDAIKYKVDGDGKITTDPAEPIAPDTRTQGDGQTRAVAKVAAGLLGVAFDQIIRRAEQARRRRKAALSGIAAGTFIFATVFSSFALYQSHQAGIAIDKSVFAIGRLIQDTDSLLNIDDLETTRKDMLRSQCDLIEGLSQDPLDTNPLEQSICISEQAQERFLSGEKEKAIEVLENKLASLNQKQKIATASEFGWIEGPRS